MKCDIHLSIEIKNLKRPKNQQYWEDTRLINEYAGSRVYEMFAVMANVGNYDGLEQIVPDRGFPKDASRRTDEMYYIPIMERKRYSKTYDVPIRDRQFMFENEAREYISKCETKVIKKKYKDGIFNSKQTYTEDVNYHSPNWCTSEELKKCIDVALKKEDGTYYFTDWFCILGVMEGYEKTGDYECRLVYWFDN